jgi:hypothetical protein
MKKLILDYFKCGFKVYPILFPLSIIIYPLNLIPLFEGTFHWLNFTALTLGVLFYIILFTIYWPNRYKFI